MRPRAAPSGATRLRGFVFVDDREHLAGVDLRAHLDAQLGEGTAVRRADLVLHLHRLDHHDRGAGLDPVTDRRLDPHHGAGHFI